jgi:hypothetical protein
MPVVVVYNKGAAVHRGNWLTDTTVCRSNGRVEILADNTKLSIIYVSQCYKITEF